MGSLLALRGRATRPIAPGYTLVCEALSANFLAARRCPLISGGAFFCIWAPKHLHPDTPILATQMLSSVAALSPAGYTSPMALPQSQVKASMASLDQLKDLAKSQNPVVVSCRKQPPTARLCIGHLDC